MLIVPRAFRASLVIGPVSHVTSAASCPDASRIFYLVVTGRVWPVRLPAGVSRHVRYGSACGFSPRGFSFRQVGWFLGPGPAPLFVSARIIPGNFGRKCMCFNIVVSKYGHVRYDSACIFCPRSPYCRLVGWFSSPGPTRPFIGA